jgi:hypothetical protein
VQGAGTALKDLAGGEAINTFLYNSSLSWKNTNNYFLQNYFQPISLKT